jgi:hypothetical protein
MGIEGTSILLFKTKIEIRENKIFYFSRQIWGMGIENMKGKSKIISI